MHQRCCPNPLPYLAISVLFLIAGCASSNCASTTLPTQNTVPSFTTDTPEPYIPTVTMAPPTQSVPTQTPTPGLMVMRFGTGQIGTDLFPYHQIVFEYERENPDQMIQVEPMPDTDYYARLVKLYGTGHAPDMVYIGDDYLRYLVNKGVLKPLEFSQTETEFDPSLYYPGLLEPGQVDGKQYLLPGDFSTLVLYYNKELFDRIGVPYPEDNWTWDTLLAAAKMLTIDADKDGKPEQWGIQMNANWDTGFEYWVAAAGGSLISPDGKNVIGFMDSPETIRAARFYADMYNVHKVAPPPVDLDAWAGGNTEFIEGKAAMLIFGRWTEQDYLANPKFDLGIASPPRDKTHANILFWSGSGLVTSSEYPVAASEFLAYSRGEESADIWKEWTLPVLSSRVNEKDIPYDPFWKIWYQELNFVKPRGYSMTPFWDEAVRPSLQSALEELITNPESDPVLVMKNAASTAQTELDGYLSQ